MFKRMVSFIISTGMLALLLGLGMVGVAASVAASEDDPAPPIFLPTLAAETSADTQGSANQTGADSATTACVELTDNFVVTADTVFCAGSYSFMDKEANGVIVIGASDITVDGSGLSLDGKNKSGYGILLNGYSGVTIQNFNISRYFAAIRADGGDGVTVQDNTVSDNGGKTEQFYDINRPLSNAYGPIPARWRATPSLTTAPTASTGSTGATALYKTTSSTGMAAMPSPSPGPAARTIPWSPAIPAANPPTTMSSPATPSSTAGIRASTCTIRLTRRWRTTRWPGIRSTSTSTATR